MSNQMKIGTLTIVFVVLISLMSFVLHPAAESELGMSLSTSGQLMSEQSTAASIIHHKDAKYYSVCENRVEQSMK